MERFNMYASLILLLLRVFFYGAVQAEQSLQQLDSAIRESAFQRLSPSPKTGFIYNVTLDSSLRDAGVRRVQAVRLRSGSLRRHGLVLNEFNIPVRSLVGTSTKYVVLIYREFASSTYPTGLPHNYKPLGPVIGIKVYQGTDLSNGASHELNLISKRTPITVRPALQGGSSGIQPLCAFFNQPGTFTLNNSSPPNVCSFSRLVDTSLVLQSAEPAPAPAPAPVPVPVPVPVPASAPAVAPSKPSASAPVAVLIPPGTQINRKGRSFKGWKVIFVVAVAGSIVLAAMAMLLLGALRMKKRARIAKMEFCSENGESLQTALIAGSRAPAAAGTRTRPVLENDYISP